MTKLHLIILIVAILFVAPLSAVSDQKSTYGQCSPIIEDIRAKYFNLTISCNEVLKLKNPSQRELSLQNLQVIAGSTSPEAIAEIFGPPNDREKLTTDFDRGDEKREKLTYRFKDGHVSRVLMREDNQTMFDRFSFTVRIIPDQTSKLWNVSLHDVYKAFAGDWYPHTLVDENKKGILAFGASNGNQIFQIISCEFDMYGSLTLSRMKDRVVWAGCSTVESAGGVFLGFEAECIDCEKTAQELFSEMGSHLLDDYYPHCSSGDGLLGEFARCNHEDNKLKNPDYEELKIAEGSADAKALKSLLAATRLVQFSGGYLSKDFPY